MISKLQIQLYRGRTPLTGVRVLQPVLAGGRSFKRTRYNYKDSQVGLFFWKILKTLSNKQGLLILIDTASVLFILQTVQCTFSCSIYGHRSKDAAWMILKLNFSSILTRKCGDSDYYDWTTLQKVGLGKNLHKGNIVEFSCKVYVSSHLVVQKRYNML